MFPTKKEYLTEYKQSGKTVQLKENTNNQSRERVVISTKYFRAKKIDPYDLSFLLILYLFFH